MTKSTRWRGRSKPPMFTGVWATFAAHPVLSALGVFTLLSSLLMEGFLWRPQPKLSQMGADVQATATSLERWNEAMTLLNPNQPQAPLAPELSNQIIYGIASYPLVRPEEAHAAHVLRTALTQRPLSRRLVDAEVEWGTGYPAAEQDAVRSLLRLKADWNPADRRRFSDGAKQMLLSVLDRSRAPLVYMGILAILDDLLMNDGLMLEAPQRSDWISDQRRILADVELNNQNCGRADGIFKHRELNTSVLPYLILPWADLVMTAQWRDRRLCDLRVVEDFRGPIRELVARVLR